MPSRREFIRSGISWLIGLLCSTRWLTSNADTKRYWLFYAGPENYLFQGGVLDLPRETFWICEPETKRGDLILVYRRSMNHLTVDDLVRKFGMARSVAADVKKARIGMDFPVIWEATSNAQRKVGWHWAYGCHCREIRRINPPILLKTLKSEPRLGEWKDLSSNLRAQGRSALEIPEFAWNVIINMIQR